MRTSRLISGVTALLVLIALVLSGCSGGGGGGGATSASHEAPAGESAATTAGTGNVTLVIQRDPGKTLNVIPAVTTALRVRVVGTGILSLVDFPRGADQVRVTLSNVPIGLRTIAVEALAGSVVVATGSAQVDVQVDAIVTQGITLIPVAGPGPSPTAAPTTIPTPGPRVLEFRGLVNRIPRGHTFTQFEVWVVRDGVADTSFNGEIALTITGGGTLTGTTSRTAAAGIAQFNALLIDASGSGHTLVASTAGLSSVASVSFEVVDTRLVFRNDVAEYQMIGQSLFSYSGGVKDAIQVELQDTGSGQRLGSATDSVVVTLDPATSLIIPNTLGGGQTAPLVNGVATFSNLFLNRSGSGLKLRATSGPGTAVPSAAFHVTPVVSDGAVFLGLVDDSLTPTVKRVWRLDLPNLGTPAATITETQGLPAPLALTVVRNVNASLPPLLYVAGDDDKLRAYQVSDFSPNGSCNLSGTPRQIRYDPRFNEAYVSIPSSMKVDLISVGNPPVSAALNFGASTSGPTGLAIDPSAVPSFWAASYEDSVVPTLSSMALRASGSIDTGWVGASTNDSFIDLVDLNGLMVGLISFGSGAINSLGAFSGLPANVNVYGAGAVANPSENRRQVRFFATDSTGTSASALVANHDSGHVEIARVTNANYAVIGRAVDPGNFVGSSGAEFIALAVDQPGGVATMAIVTDPSKKRLMLVDLTTTPLPTIFHVIQLPLIPSAITVRQIGVLNTY